MKRRSFIISAPSTLLAPPAIAQELINGSKAIPAVDHDTFIAISSLLTGVPTKTFEGILERDRIFIVADNLIWYFSAVRNAYTEGSLEILLSLYRDMVADKATPEQIADAIFINAKPQMKSMSGMIMKIWLYGVWFGTSQSQYITNPEYKRDFVLSANAYVNSFSWKIAQAHPMGYSNFPFGSWGEKPPTLKEFGITI